jgi:hypothetical protein
MQRQLKICLIAWTSLLGVRATIAPAQDIGPLVEISQPNAVGSCNTGFNAFGTWPTDNAQEPFVAVNPANPNNIVASWIQGPFQDIDAAVTFDSGQNWQRVPIPFTTCSGGPFPGAGDPRVAFAQNGDLYAIAVTGSSVSAEVIGVSKSTDGGLHWSAAIPVSANLAGPFDLPVLTPDPADAQTVYAIWDGTSQGHRGPSIFTRTTNGGATWEPPRILFQTDPQAFVQFSQILVLPNGTLVDIFEFEEQQPNKPCTLTNLQMLRSTDRGQTWSAPTNAITLMPLDTPSCNTLVVDSETGQLVADPTNPSFAVDSRNGNLYAVWEDGRFSNFQYNDIAFAMSADGGLTWSAPIRVNQTPLNIPPLDRQSFLPAMAVLADGTIGVSYYDFRFNDPNPGLPTDRWLVQCQPSSTSAATNPSCWGSEVRLTNTSFNMELVVFRPAGAPGFFLGDYMPLAVGSHDFVAVFTQPDSNNVASVFARRVGP